MSEVALLIFDEAHHAVKRHPYNLIMQEFYHQVGQQRGSQCCESLSVVKSCSAPAARVPASAWLLLACVGLSSTIALL